MSSVIDIHSHIFPASFEKRLPQAGRETLGAVRKRLRHWMRPYATTMHQTQPLLRHLPKIARKNLDFLSGLAPLPNLFVESTAADLEHAMNEAQVDLAVIIAHPPLISNEMILDAASENRRFIPAVNIPKNADRPGALLRRFVKQGAKLLKIHPAADGEGPKSARYQSLLKAATDLGLPVILHTGCIHSQLIYKNAEMGKAELFAPWFKSFPELKFILAHMNFHEPQIALDLAVEHPHIYVDTSWQPAETIGEAVRRIGAERVLFGTDWPIVGNNLSIGRKRIQESVQIGLITEAQSQLILGKNAVQLLGLSSN